MLIVLNGRDQWSRWAKRRGARIILILHIGEKVEIRHLQMKGEVGNVALMPNARRHDGEGRRKETSMFVGFGAFGAFVGDGRKNSRRRSILSRDSVNQFLWYCSAAR